ncbi:U2 small nuclear ribonucleo protein B [Corynespora cassiicola Philippines]|uniref:U2 small nuclear ribonucleo protein B n=1 Tax=Corynespora cassiicola Philippines TaxID=1448308 RepID=A0A2T2N4N7_CORCC|nr:U2 small nuclear ribonucleo protein B [Corynespora cassiicola Philippines]
MATTARPPPPPPPGAKQDPPNRTLYVKNLPDQLRKDDLKRNLYMLFATYGVILDIVALKTMKMRGQAHIVFRDVESSTQALRALQGSQFFGRDMQIFYGRGKSHIIQKLDGTFQLPEKNLPLRESSEPPSNEIAFASAPAKAVPVNEQDRAKGVKRGREEEEEDDEDDAEMEMDVSDSD